MDHYTAEAYEHVRKRIVGKIDELEAYKAKYPGKKPGSGDIFNLKNWRRFGAGFAWDPEVYIDIMANPDMSDVELMRALRNTEATLMKKWGVIDKMPLHHKIALRTGGDLGLRTPVDVWMQTRERIYERFGFNPGNGPKNLGAHTQFNELVHLERIGGGKEFKQSGAPPSVIEEIQKAEVGLHRPNEDLGNLPKQYKPLIGASSAQQAAYLEEYIIGQIERFKQATDFERTQWMNNTFDDGINWFADLGGEGPRISGFSSANSVEDQALLKQAAKAIEHYDQSTGEVKNLAQLSADAFVAPEAPKLDTNNLSFNPDSKEGKKFLKMVNGGAHLDILKNPLVRKLAIGVPLLGTAWSAGTVEVNAAERDKEIQSNPNDPTLPVNKTLDQVSGWGDRVALTGMGLTATGVGAPIGIPMVAAGEAVSTTTGLMSLAFDGGRALLKRDWAGERKKLERQEQLRAKPADAPERENALSVGFAGGM